MKKKEKAFNNWKANSVHLNFPNGNQVSMLWGARSYSENHFVGMKEAPNYLTSMDRYHEFMQSDDVEVMVSCGDRLLERLNKKFDGGNPFGYLNITDWLYIVNAVAKEKKED